MKTSTFSVEPSTADEIEKNLELENDQYTDTYDPALRILYIYIYIRLCDYIIIYIY